MAETKLTAEARTSFGKGAARTIRRANRIPAVVYGHGEAPIHVSLPGHDTMIALRSANVLLDIDLDGTSHLTLPKDVQRDPIKGFIEHVDLLVVRRGEKVTVDVPVVVQGESFSGTIHVQDLSSVSLLVLATAIPEHVVVDVEGLEDGKQITASELTLPEGAELETDGDALVVQIVTPRGTADDEAADEASAEAGAEAGAEGGSAPVDADSE